MNSRTFIGLDALGLGLERAAAAAWRILATAARIACAGPAGRGFDAHKTGVLRHAAGACVAVNTPHTAALGDGAKA